MNFKNFVLTNFGEGDMTNEDKIEDVEEHIKEILDDSYNDENNGDDEHHVKGVQNVCLNNFKLVDNFQHRGFTQLLCKASPQTFGIVVDCINYENLNMISVGLMKLNCFYKVM